MIPPTGKILIDKEIILQFAALFQALRR